LKYKTGIRRQAAKIIFWQFDAESRLYSDAGPTLSFSEVGWIK